MNKASSNHTPRHLFISRHMGAIAWAKNSDLKIDEIIPHLNIDQINAGDKIFGSLPVNIVYKVCQKGARYYHLNLKLPEHARGQELTEEDMEKYSANFEEFIVTKSMIDFTYSINYG